MIIGLPREQEINENRVGLTPDNIKELINDGHQVIVEHQAGLKSGFSDEAYQAAGATLVEEVAKVWAAEMVIKVKKPLKEEYAYFHKGLILFSYLHLAADPDLAQALLDNEVTCIAYETMADKGTLPLLKPMSEVAGRMAVQIGAHLLEKNHGGPGILLGGVPGVKRANVTIIGGGVVGLNSAKLACGLGANVTIIDINPQRLAKIEHTLGSPVQTLISNEANIHESVVNSDLVIGSVLVAGRRAPILVKEETVQQMKSGSVLIDVAVDQGGNFATTHETTHSEPTYVKYGVTHYAVSNIPGAVPQTATIALTNASLFYTKEIANKGIVQAAKDNHTILTGINTYQGHITNLAVAESQDREFVALEALI